MLSLDGTLADLYDAFAMPDALRTAYKNLDTAVDKAFGAGRRINDNTECLELVLKYCAEITVEAP